MKSIRLYLTVAIALGLACVVAVPAWSQTPVPQNTVWRVVVGENDRMTTTSTEERDAFPLEGQMFYVPSWCVTSNSKILNRYNNGPDHMDSVSPVDGYSLEGPLTCTFPLGTALAGLTPINESFNPTTGDHALTRVGEFLPGYTKWGALGVMGYQRFGNVQEALLNVKGSQLSVDSNLVAGGNVWHWTWNGLQYLNLGGYARGMHAELFGLVDGNGTAYESGDGGSFFPDVPANIHGAPLMAAFTNGKTQTTLAVPLEFTPEVWGGDLNHPVVWQDIVIGKQLTLDFNGDPSVARYRAYLYYPAPNDSQDLNFRPVAYLRGIFTRYFTYDAIADELTEITDQLTPCSATGHFFQTAIGGLIVSDTSGQYALGVYGADTANGGTVSRFGVRPRICPGNGSYWANPELETSWSTVVLLHQYIGPISREINTFDRYVVTNSLDNVHKSMRRLYRTGVR